VNSDVSLGRLRTMHGTTSGHGRLRLSAMQEELGWRGFALPRRQQHRNAFDASILLGLAWGLWHLPLYFVLGTGQSEMLRLRKPRRDPPAETGCSRWLSPQHEGETHQ